MSGPLTEHPLDAATQAACAHQMGHIMANGGWSAGWQEFVELRRIATPPWAESHVYGESQMRYHYCKDRAVLAEAVAAAEASADGGAAASEHQHQHQQLP